MRHRRNYDRERVECWSGEKIEPRPWFHRQREVDVLTGKVTESDRYKSHSGRGSRRYRWRHWVRGVPDWFDRDLRPVGYDRSYGMSRFRTVPIDWGGIPGNPSRNEIVGWTLIARHANCGESECRDCGSGTDFANDPKVRKACRLCEGTGYIDHPYAELLVYESAEWEPDEIETIAESAARWVYVSTLASACDAAREDARENPSLANRARARRLAEYDPGPGGDWHDTCPDTPTGLVRTIARMIARTWSPEGLYGAPDLETVGHDLGNHLAGDGAASVDLPDTVQAWIGGFPTWDAGLYLRSIRSVGGIGSTAWRNPRPFDPYDDRI